MTLFPVDPVEAVPGRSRKRDPETSKKAARNQICTVVWGGHRARLLLAYQEHGSLTDPQAAVFAKLDRHAATKRISELLGVGLIARTGQKRKTSMGGEGRVCRLTDPGRKALYRARKAVKK